MNSICLLTDSFAQFYSSQENTHDFLFQIPLTLQIGDKKYHVDQANIDEVLTDCDHHQGFNLLIPEKEKIIQQIEFCQKHYRDIIIITHSKFFTGLFSTLEKLREYIPQKQNLYLINSNTFSFGMGFLIQNAIHKILSGESARSIVNDLQTQISNIYTYFFTPDLHYISHAGFIENAQAISLEILNLFPIFSFEDGKFNPLEKINSRSKYYQFLEEFINEFSDIDQAIFIYGIQKTRKEVPALHNYLKEIHPDAKFFSHIMNPITKAMLGPKSMGLFVISDDK
jgi:DegV family protein with EDD domain